MGGGIGGLTLGAALGQRGISADIAEMRDTTSIFGVGIIQPGNALRALGSIGVLSQCLESGFPFSEWRLHDATGRVFASVPSILGQDAIPPSSGISRRDLHRILTKAALGAGATIHLKTTLLALEEEHCHVTATLSNGQVATYDLVVGFDGIRSSLRQRLFGSAYQHPVYTGHAVWRFMTERPPDLTYGALYFGRACKVGLVPLGEKKMYLFAVTHEPGNPCLAPEEFPSMLRRRLRHHDGIVAELRECIRSWAEIVYSPIEEVSLPEPWYRGRVLLCGDAAHASAPHLAQGAAMAIEDAVVLAELLDGPASVSEKLAAFMRRRLPRCRAVQDVSHQLLRAEMQAHDATPIPSEAPSSPYDARSIERLLAQPA